MQPALRVKVLAGKAQVAGHPGAIPIRVFAGRAHSKGVAVPAPHDLVRGVREYPGGVQVVGVHVEGGAVGADDRHGLTIQPDGLPQPGSVAAVFTQQFPGFVVDVTLQPVGRAPPGLLDPLAQAVVAVAGGLAIPGELAQPACIVVGKAIGAIVDDVAGRVEQLSSTCPLHCLMLHVCLISPRCMTTIRGGTPMAAYNKIQAYTVTP